MKSTILMDRPDNVSLRVMRSRDGLKLKWAAYRNADGHIVFLPFGPGTAHKTPPEKMPDCGNTSFPGYTYLGICNVANATIEQA